MLIVLSLVLVCLGVTLWYLGPEPSAEAGERPNIILIVGETLRADRIQFHGSRRLTMPVLEHFAREGVIFEQATTVAPWTLPSVASLLTGLPPSALGIRQYEDQLPDAADTLAEAFKRRGYRTAFLGVNSLFELGRNLQQGFDYYLGIDEIPGTELNERLLAWLHGRSDDSPVFLYVHYFEPHCRYAPPSHYHELFWPPLPAERTERKMTLEQWSQMHECFQLFYGRDEPILDVDYYLSQYDAEIRLLDQVLGMFFERLKTFGLYDSSLIAFTSDHGEEFYEHGGYGHGKVLTQEVLHVPLILRLPRGEGGGQRILERVSTLDVFPTLAGAAGIKPRHEGFGVNLLPVIRGQTPLSADRALVSETDYEGKQRAVLLGHYKWLVSPDQTRPTGLYDLEADPGEKLDLSSSHRNVLERLSRALGDHENRARTLGREIPGSRQELSQETLEQLKSLGYIF